MATKILKVGMNDCKPCKDVDGYLLELSKTFDFEIETLNITSEDFKERKKGKQTLAKYGTIKVPLLIFSVDGEDKASIYREHVLEDSEGYLTKAKEILNGLNPIETVVNSPS